MSISSAQLVQFLLKQLNQARTNPQQIITRLQSRIFLSQNQYQHSGVPSMHYLCQEGQSALQQAVIFLQKQVTLQKLVLSESLCQFAFQLGSQIVQNNISDTETILQELIKICNKTNKNVNKNVNVNQQQLPQLMIEFGLRFDPQILNNILVSDGDKERTNRNILLSNSAKYIGISVHEHVQYDFMAVFLIGNKEPEMNSKCSCNIC